MSTTTTFNDLAGRLQEVFALPVADRANAVVKKDLFTRLLYEPVGDRNLFLADIAITQKLEFAQAQKEFTKFASETEAGRKAAPVKLSTIPKRTKSPAPEPEPLSPSAGGKRLTKCLADVKPEKTDWLWEPYFPMGAVSLITGDPDAQKTFFSLDLVSRLSRGTKWIDGKSVGEPANTIYLTMEDSLEKTIRPRLDGLGGDPDHVFAYDRDEMLNLKNDEGLKNLEDEIVFIENVRLVIIDPVIDFAPSVDPNKAQEVRALLNPLADMAERLGFALLIVGHLNKSQAMNAIYRAGGSTSGWLGKCRAGFIIFRDTTEEEKGHDNPLRHVVRLKANLAMKDPPQLEFRVTDGQMLGRVTDKEKRVDVDAHLNPNRGKTGPKPREMGWAVEFLENLFADRDEIPADEVTEAAEENGIAERTLKRAKAKGGFISTRSGKQWVWKKITISKEEK